MMPKQLALSAAKQAGAQLKKLFFSRKFRVQTKSKHEIVTTADKIAEKIILTKIKTHFPTHRILSEESGFNKQRSDYLWVVDPLDGTTNFVMHNPLFSVSIALLYKLEIILAVVYVPILNELYVAEKNKDTYLNNKPIRVSHRANIENAYLTFCHGSEIQDIKKAIKIYNKLKLKARDFRQLGSAAIELAYVSHGLTDCIIIPGALRWDVSAGILLVREAGGKVTDFQDKEWTVNSRDMLATNGNIHNDLLKILKQHGYFRQN